MAQYNAAFPSVDATTIANLQTAGTDTATVTNSYVSNTKTSDTNSLVSNLNAAEAISQQAKVYAYTLGTNASLSTIAKDLTDANNAINTGASGTYTRQSEINEWQAQNKMDTLFFLQLLFLALTLTVILVYLRQTGILPNSVMWMLVGFMVLILAGILWNRTSYTNVSRDPRYWNRRYIGLTDSGLSAKVQCSNS
jgi:hypothetical protein